MVCTRVIASTRKTLIPSSPLSRLISTPMDFTTPPLEKIPIESTSLRSVEQIFSLLNVVTYVKNATVEILKKCPGQKQAILWHEFCMVRYSNEAILGNVAYSPFDWGHSIENVPNEDKFYKELNMLLDSLRDHAAFNRSPKKFAAASRPYPEYRTIYAFEQCTPDISSDECGECLKKSALQIRECCDGARGVRILRPSCYLRFETDPFYNETMVKTLP
ncbi:Cysteine-rich receptor-like protein kinase 25 [Forsythia ovata]|uniref:Cysteine-rich receptor-like protein kinase 25 n=1 Tax=Forsythia ovata TaxID=205694 RepID=A0ABD1R6H4_9LAMI